MNTGLQELWHERERERLRWTPSYANSNQLNGVRGDETSLSGGEERESRTHDFPCFPWLVRILPAGLCKGDREIRLANLGRGEHVGVDGAPIISLGQTGKNYKHRLSLFANWIIQHFVSRKSRTRHYSVGCYSFCGKNGKCKLKKWIVFYIHILRISTDVFIFSFFRQFDGALSSLAPSSPPPPTCACGQ